MTDSTEHMSDEAALMWCMVQPTGTQFEIDAGFGDWADLRAKKLSEVAQVIENGCAIRIAAPKPQAPERVWCGINKEGSLVSSSVVANVVREEFEYIRRDIAESTMPRGRIVLMAPYGPSQAAWFVCDESDPNAHRVLILEEGSHD